MDLLKHALQSTAGTAAQRGQGSGHSPGLLVLGAGGTLGSAVLEQALACGRFAPVQALVDAELSSALRGFVALPAQAFARAVPTAAPPQTALMVFERGRHSNGRDDAFTALGEPDLLPWAQRLASWGVQRLLVVVPHAPAMLPGSLKAGFASSAEQAVSALGFEHLVFLRSAQAAGASAAAAQRLQRLADWWLSQLRLMVPQTQAPVRAARLAQLVVQLTLALDKAPAGTRVVPPELLSLAATAADSDGVLQAWLQTWQERWQEA